MGEEQKFFETTDAYVLHGRDDEVGIDIYYWGEGSVTLEEGFKAT